jgi:RNA polymerase sigma factor (TIGR02999 family)
VSRSQDADDPAQELLDSLDASDDQQVLEQVMALVYDDLKRVARRQLYRARYGNTLDTTALVHESYLKLAGSPTIVCEDRGHFFGIAARAMRQIIVDYARRRQAEKRGGDQERVPLEGAEASVWEDADSLIALDEALTRLAAFDSRLMRLVECRFFAGFTEEETANALGISRSTVQREWIRARAWLREEVGSEGKGRDRG